MVVFQPEISKSYGMVEWRDDLKVVLKSAGAQGKHTVFLITDAQIKMESFLEDIDNLLNTGEVPNLFAPDEKQEILEVRLLWVLMGSYLENKYVYRLNVSVEIQVVCDIFHQMEFIRNFMAFLSSCFFLF